MQNNTEFVLVKKESESSDVTSLFFKTAGGEKYEFLAGQYVDIVPPNIDGHGKSYTISSSPNDELVRITIKRQGAVSSALIEMGVGQKVSFEGPYGVFYPEENMKDVVMLAGGIGITPFVSVIKDHHDSKKDTKFILLYSNKTKSDATFAKKLTEIENNNNNLKTIYFTTQDKTGDENSRISADLVQKHVPDIQDKKFYICGSISFVRDVWKMLKSVEVPEENIYTESFY